MVNFNVNSKDGTIESFIGVQKKEKFSPKNVSSNLSIIDGNREKQAVQAGNFEVFPWGEDNLLPNNLAAIYQNNLAPALLDFKSDMMFGDGFFLFDKKSKTEVENSQEIDWLESWDVLTYLIEQIADFVFYENSFGQFRKSISGDKIADILHIAAKECRLEKTDANEVKNIVVGNFQDNSDFKKYPKIKLFGSETFSSNVAMYHQKKPKAGFKYYNYPVYIGVMNHWLDVANEIPKFHKANLKNQLTAAYHVTVPLSTMQNLKEKNKWSDAQLNNHIQTELKKVTDVLSGSENAGKTFFSFEFSDENGKPYGNWTIKLIESNAKERSESNLKLSAESNQAFTAAFRVPTSLASIQIGEKLSSGSEVLNEYNVYKTQISLARKIILAPINFALKYNFPQTNCEIRFKDIKLVSQEENKNGIKNENI